MWPNQEASTILRQNRVVFFPRGLQSVYHNDAAEFRRTPCYLEVDKDHRRPIDGNLSKDSGKEKWHEIMRTGI